MPTETGTIDLKAQSNAAKTATNYIAIDTDGIKIANENPSTATTYQHQTATETEFMVNGESMMKIGADGQRIGKPYVEGATDNENHLELDYHSLQMVDKEGTTYLYVSDLRDRSGMATLVEGGERVNLDAFPVSMPIASVDYVTVDGKTLDPSEYEVLYGSVFIDEDQPIGSMVEISYKTDSPDVKAFTLGTRKAGSSLGAMSHADGCEVEASGALSHAGGSRTVASGFCSDAEGSLNRASGYVSHAEGESNVASASWSHAEGHTTFATGSGSHSEGSGTRASGKDSHAQNVRTIAASANQTAIGRYNIEDKNDTYALIIGNGTSESDRSNALAARWDGTIDRTTNGVEIGATRDEILWNNLIRASDSIDGFADAGHVHLREVYGTAGEYSAQLEVTRIGTTAGTVHNGVRMQIDNDGKRVVYVSDAAAWRRALGMPAGIIQMYAGATAPSGWLWCNGQAVSRTTYAELFAAIGTTWGAGNGSTTFNVPDLRGRTPIGAGQGSGLTARTLGGKVGSETHTLNADQIPAHTHGSKTLTGGFRARHYGTSGDGAQLVFTPSGIVDIDTKTGTLGKVNVGGVGNNGGYEQVTVNATHTHDSVGGGKAHNNMQPSAVVNFIISAGVTS